MFLEDVYLPIFKGEVGVKGEIVMVADGPLKAYQRAFSFLHVEQLSVWFSWS